MKVDVSKLPKSEVKVRVEVPEELLFASKEEVLKNFSANMNLPGFRPGKIPSFLVEEKIGAEVLRNRLIDKVLPETFRRAVSDTGLKIVCRPKVTLVSSEPFVYEAHVAVFPDISVKDEDSITVSKKDVHFSDEDLAELLSDLRKKHAEFQEVDRDARKGDKVEIDFEGFDENGVKLEGTESKNHPLVIGDGLFVRDFEENLVGLSSGSEKEFFVTFPKDYRHKPFRGKKVMFKVKIQKVFEVVLPEIDESFILKITGVKQDRATFEEALKKEGMTYRELEEKQRRRDELLRMFLDRCVFEVSDMLIDEETDFMVERLEADLAEKGIRMEDYMKMLEEKGKDLRKDLRNDAKKRISMRLILQYLFEKHKIVVSDEEVKQYREKHDSGFSDAEVRNTLHLEKLFDHFLAL